MENRKAVSGIVRNEENKILVFFHEKYKLWSIPVGKVEGSENICTAFTRELYEEFNITSFVFNKIGSIIRETNAIGTKTEITIVDVKDWFGSFLNREPDKHTHIAWVTDDEFIQYAPVTEAMGFAINYITNNKEDHYGV